MDFGSLGSPMLTSTTVECRCVVGNCVGYRHAFPESPKEEKEVWKAGLFAHDTLVNIPRPPRSPPHLLLALLSHRIIVEMRIGGLGIRVLHARQSSRGGHQKRRVDRRRSCEFDIML